MKGDAPHLPEWIDRLHPFTERYTVGVENHRVHVMERGEGRPVVAIHGNPTWGFLYRRVAAELRGEPFRFVAPDLVGLGLSTRPSHVSAHTVENHARWLAGTLDQLVLDDWLLVVQDWGGPIGLLAADRMENKPSGIVLLNTVVTPPKPDFRPTAFHRFSRLPVVSDVAFRVLGFPQRKLSVAQADPSSIAGAVSDAYRWPLRMSKGNAAPLELARMVPDSMEHPSIEPMHRCQAFLEAFEGPIAGVWGEDDPVLGSVGRWVEKVLPDMRMVYARAGHFLQEEVPRPIADAIRYVDAASS